MGFFPPADVLLQTISTAAQVPQGPSAALWPPALLGTVWDLSQPTPNQSPRGRGQGEGSPLFCHQAKWSCQTEDHQAV